jgi:hypothetical protein
MRRSLMNLMRGIGGAYQIALFQRETSLSFISSLFKVATQDRWLP